MGNGFSTAAGIAVAACLREVGVKLHSAVTKPLIGRKNQKAKCTFAEKHVVWREKNWSKVHFSDESKFNLSLMGNILFGDKVMAKKLTVLSTK